MYDNPCKHCENFGHCMHMMNMPVYGYHMPMMEEEDDDDDLKKLYPNIYTRMYPIVNHHCDMVESRYGTMYCPTKDEMERICKQICDKYEEYNKDEDDDDEDYRNDDDDDMRKRRRRRRRRSNEDLIKILFIRDLLGRRRRRRRRHNYGYWY